MRSRAFLVLCAVLWAALPARGEEPPAREEEEPSGREAWLPPDVQEAAVQQLAGRMDEAGFGGSDESRPLEGSRRMVEAMATQIESMGEEGILGNAPTFPELDLPRAGQRHLDAMAGYSVCNLVLTLQHAERDQRDANARMAAALGLSAFTLAIVSLRHPYLVEGHEVSEIEAFLTSPAMNTAYERVQQDPAAREAVEGRCSPALVALLAFADE